MSFFLFTPHNSHKATAKSLKDHLNLFSFLLPAVLFCHAHFKTYLLFQSNSLCLQAKLCPPAVNPKVHHSRCCNAQAMKEVLVYQT